DLGAELVEPRRGSHGGAVEGDLDGQRELEPVGQPEDRRPEDEGLVGPGLAVELLEPGLDLGAALRDGLGAVEPAAGRARGLGARAGHDREEERQSPHGARIILQIGGGAGTGTVMVCSAGAAAIATGVQTTGSWSALSRSPTRSRPTVVEAGSAT